MQRHPPHNGSNILHPTPTPPPSPYLSLEGVLSPLSYCATCEESTSLTGPVLSLLSLVFLPLLSHDTSEKKPKKPKTNHVLGRLPRRKLYVFRRVLASFFTFAAAPFVPCNFPKTIWFSDMISLRPHSPSSPLLPFVPSLLEYCDSKRGSLVELCFSTAPIAKLRAIAKMRLFKRPSFPPFEGYKPLLSLLPGPFPSAAIRSSWQDAASTPTTNTTRHLNSAKLTSTHHFFDREQRSNISLTMQKSAQRARHFSASHEDSRARAKR